MCVMCQWIGRTKRRKVFVTGTLKRPVPLQYFLFHKDEVAPLMLADGRFRSGVIGEVTRREKERDKPKPKTAENQAMADDRKGEKLALASERAGRQVKAAPEKTKVSTGIAGQRSTGAIGGTKMQWVNLLHLLKSGGREEAGGLKAIDFGTGYSNRVLSAAAKKEKGQMVPYDKLPSEMKASMTKQVCTIAVYLPILLLIYTYIYHTTCARSMSVSKCAPLKTKWRQSKAVCSLQSSSRSVRRSARRSLTTLSTKTCLLRGRRAR